MKFNLLKGFWQIPLTNRAKEISAFVTKDVLYQYKVMLFGMKNSHTLSSSAKNCNDTYKLSDLVKLNITVNFTKSEFCHGNLTVLVILLDKVR